MSRHRPNCGAAPSPENTITVTVNPAPGRSDDEFVYAHARYAALREAALSLTAEQARAMGVISFEQRLTPITPAALRAYRSQWGTRHWSGHGGWNWEEKVRRYARKPRAFHAALWSGPTLCGLCIGSVCKSKAHLTLHFMESAPDPGHPLRGSVTEVMFSAARNYALALGIPKIYLREPLQGVLERYRRFGFSLASESRGPVYFQLELTESGDPHGRRTHEFRDHPARETRATRRGTRAGARQDRRGCTRANSGRTEPVRVADAGAAPAQSCIAGAGDPGLRSSAEGALTIASGTFVQQTRALQRKPERS